MAAAEWRRPWACMAAVNCSSSKELSCRDATSFSASWEPRERGKTQLLNHCNGRTGLGLRSGYRQFRSSRHSRIDGEKLRTHAGKDETMEKSDFSEFAYLSDILSEILFSIFSQLVLEWDWESYRRHT